MLLQRHGFVLLVFALALLFSVMLSQGQEFVPLVFAVAFPLSERIDLLRSTLSEQNLQNFLR